jgi:hypothetical protein
MDLEWLRGRCVVTDLRVSEANLDKPQESGDNRLSVVLCYDHPFDAVALDESLFSLAAQEHEHLEVVLVMPECGRTFHECAEAAILSQPWPDQARARVVSVSTRACRTISAELLNAGLLHSTGQYVAFLHHQDLVYQHAYRALLERLRSSDAAIAFGGVRMAAHAQASRHWMVTNKELARTEAVRLRVALDEHTSIHSFVVDRVRLGANDLFVQNPMSRLAVTLFLLRLALHPQADFELAGKKMFESRTPPSGSAAVGDSGLGRMASTQEVLTFLAADAVHLRPEAWCATTLLAEAIHALSAGKRSAAS